MSSQSSESDNRKVYSKCGKYIYHICIIDYLQTYNMHKKLEKFAKRVFLFAKGNELSTNPPDFYCKRFQDFVKEKILLTQNQQILKNSFKHLYIDEQTK